MSDLMRWSIRRRRALANDVSRAWSQRAAETPKGLGRNNSNCKRALFIFLIQFVGIAVIATNTKADEPVGTLTFAARPAQILEEGHATTFTGHAFLIIGLHTSSGVKEEVFGFYPVEGGKGMVKGSGMLKAETRCGPNDDCGPKHQAQLLQRLSEVKESVTVPISLEERNAVYAEIKKWDSKSFAGAENKQVVPASDAQYRLFDSNCIDFVAGVASRLGYSTPDRSLLQTPAEFMSAFKPLAQQELKVREAKNETAKMKKRASEAEAEAQRADAARRKAEGERDEAQRQAETVPVGWIQCTCPHLHGAYGRVIRGQLWHPSNIRCDN